MLALVAKMRDMHKELKAYRSLELKSNINHKSRDEHDHSIKACETVEASCQTFIMVQEP